MYFAFAPALDWREGLYRTVSAMIKETASRIPREVTASARPVRLIQKFMIKRSAMECDDGRLETYARLANQCLGYVLPRRDSGQIVDPFLNYLF